MTARKTPVHTWLQLLRAPNLFTVPGDPLAGYLMACSLSYPTPDLEVLIVILAGLCFYGYGLLLNDLADLEEDRRERPNRPLPSGAASLRDVCLATIIAAAAALGLCFLRSAGAFALGLILVVAIAAYNLWSKKIALLGPLNMGLCRGLSLLLGARLWSKAPLTHFPIPVLVAAGALTLYIALVTNLARIETQANPAKLPRLLPFPGLLLGLTSFFFLSLDWEHQLAPLNVAIGAVAISALYAGFEVHRKLNREPAPPIPPMIGQLIRLLLPLQAIWCLSSRSPAGWIAAGALMALWPVSRHVSRRFYAS